MNRKILYLIMGIALIVFGILSIVDRRLPIVMTGIAAIIYGVGQLIHWRERTRIGAAGTWALLSTLFSIIFGVFIIAGNWFAVFMARYILISVSVWLIAEGVLQILGAIMYRKAMTTEDLGVQAPGSVSSMVCGGCRIAAGLLGIIFPAFAENMALLCVAGGLIIIGIRLVWMARHAGQWGNGNEI